MTGPSEQALDGIGLFALLAAEDRVALAQAAFGRRLARGQVLFDEGEPSDFLYVVRRGRLKIQVTSPRGEDLVLAVIGPGEVLGELSMIDGEARSAGVEALDAVELLAVPAAAVRERLAGNPEALFSVAVELATGLRRLTGNTADLVFLDLPRRLAKLVLRLADGAAGADLGMNQSEVAAMLGVTRQSLNRALAALARRGWVELEGSYVRVLDVVALQRFALS